MAVSILTTHLLIIVVTICGCYGGVTTTFDGRGNALFHCDVKEKLNDNLTPDNIKFLCWIKLGSTTWICFSNTHEGPTTKRNEFQGEVLGFSAGGTHTIRVRNDGSAWYCMASNKGFVLAPITLDVEPLAAQMLTVNGEETSPNSEIHVPDQGYVTCEISSINRIPHATLFLQKIPFPGNESENLKNSGLVSSAKASYQLSKGKVLNVYCVALYIDKSWIFLDNIKVQTSKVILMTEKSHSYNHVLMIIIPIPIVTFISFIVVRFVRYKRNENMFQYKRESFI